MYDGDAPLAERRAGALTLDRDLLRELLGQEELRELLDPEALADLELSLQALTDDRRATTADQLHDLLRRLGDLSADEIAARTEGGAVASDAWLTELVASRRAVPARVAGDDRWIAIEDVARYRDGVGVSPPTGVPDAFLAPATAALDGLLARYARTHGPFLTPDPARRWGLPIGVVDDALERLLEAGTILRGEFRPGGSEREWIDPDVLRILRRRSLARLRREVEPVDPAVARAVPAGVARRCGRRRRTAALFGPSRLWSASPRSSTSSRVSRSRPRFSNGTCCRPGFPGYQPRLLDELGAMGEVAWVGRGSLGSRRRADRAVSARSRGPSTGRPRRRRRRTRRSPPRGDSRAPAPAGRLVLPGAVRGRRRRLGSRGPRCAVGSRLGRGGHERHLRSAPRAALEAARPRRAAPARPADVARSAGGRRPLVAGRARRARRSAGDRGAATHRHGTPPRAEPRAARPARRRDPRGRRDRGRRGRILGRLCRPPGARGGRPDPPRLLRRRARSRAVRPGGRARAPARDARAGPLAARNGRSICSPPPIPPIRTARRSRGPAAARRTGGRSSGRPAPTSCSSMASRRCTSSAAAGRCRRCRPRTTRRWPRPRFAALERPARGPPGSRARHHQGRRAAGRRVAVPRATDRGGLHARLPRAHAARPALRPSRARGRHALPHGGRAPAASRRPDGDGGAGAPAGPADRAGRRDDDRGGRIAGQEPPDPVRQRARAPDAPPDERLVAPLPARASDGAGPKRAPASSSRCPARSPSASTRRSSSCSSSGPRRSTPRSRRSGRTCSTRRSTMTAPRRRSAGCAIRPAPRLTISEALLDQRALAGIGNIWRNETLFVERTDPFADGRRASTTPRSAPRRDRPAPAHGERDARAGPRPDARLRADAAGRARAAGP